MASAFTRAGQRRKASCGTGKRQTVCEQALRDQKRKALLRGYVRLRCPRGEYRGVSARRRDARKAGSTNEAAAKAAACRIRRSRMRRAAQVRQSAARVSGGVLRGERGQGMEKAAVGGIAGARRLLSFLKLLGFQFMRLLPQSFPPSYFLCTLRLCKAQRGAKAPLKWACFSLNISFPVVNLFYGSAVSVMCSLTNSEQ